MGLVAIIRPEKVLTMRQWVEAAASIAELQRPAEREIVNPFTKRPTTYRPPPGHFEIRFDGEVAGAVQPGNDFSGTGELFVYGRPHNSVLVRFIERTAIALGGGAEWINEP